MRKESEVAQVDNATGTIITYQPDLLLLKQNLSALVPQVSGVWLYDNGSANVEDIRNLISDFPSVELIENRENLGLPINYNKAARKTGNADGNAWLLILDQDTVLPEGYVHAASAFFDRKDVSIICPLYWDINAESFEEFQKRMPPEETSYVKRCISSGSICRVRDILDFGGFDEQMFIDYVDYDYCRTVMEHGRKILRLNRFYLQHQIGHSKTSRFLWKNIVVTNHSAFRWYYFFRNYIYFIRKHKLGLWTAIKSYKALFIRFLIILFHEDDKWNKLCAILKGFADGFKMKLK